MKKILLILPLLFISISVIKSQIGNYCQDLVFTKSCYEFEENNRFKFIDFMCIAITEGQGSFEIEDNKIRFIYELIPFFEEQFSIKRIKEVQDKVEIKFSVKDYDTGKDITEYSVHQMKRGQFENEINHLKNRISVKYEGKPISINISCSEYSNYTFQITESGQYKLALFLKFGRESDIYEMKDGIEEFTILELTEDKIILKDEENNYKITLVKEK